MNNFLQLFPAHLHPVHIIFRDKIPIERKHSVIAVFCVVILLARFVSKKMFSLNENNRYYLCTHGTDMRKGFNTLMGIITSTSPLRPLDGSVYIFINKTRTTIKILHWERGGFVIYHKRLEMGRISKTAFGHPENFRPIRWDELVLFIEGINPKIKRRKRYNKPL